MPRGEPPEWSLPRTSRQYSPTREEEPRSRTYAASSRRQSRRYRSAIDDGSQTEPERATIRSTRSGSRRYSETDDDASNTDTRRASAKPRRRTMTVAEEATEASRTTARRPSNVVSRSRYDEQTTEPSTTTARATETRATALTTARSTKHPRARDTAIVAAAVAVDSKRSSAVSPKHSPDARSHPPAEASKRRDSMSPTASPSKEQTDDQNKRSKSVTPERASTAVGARGRARSQPPSTSEQSSSSTSMPKSMAAPSSPWPPAPPCGPQWRKRVHVVEIRKPDGRIIEEREVLVHSVSG